MLLQNEKEENVAKPSEPRTTWDEGIRGKWHNGWPPEGKELKPKALEGQKPVSGNAVKTN